MKLLLLGNPQFGKWQRTSMTGGQGSRGKASYAWQVNRRKLQVGRTPCEVLSARYKSEEEIALSKAHL